MYSMNCIAKITQMELEPKNKGSQDHLIRNGLKQKILKFYNLLRSTEKLKYDKFNRKICKTN